MWWAYIWGGGGFILNIFGGQAYSRRFPVSDQAGIY